MSILKRDMMQLGHAGKAHGAGQTPRGEDQPGGGGLTYTVPTRDKNRKFRKSAKNDCFVNWIASHERLKGGSGR